MAYNEDLAARVRALLAEQPALTERKMFGGLAFMVQGNMCCGIVREELMVRVGPERYAAALALPHTREMDFTGRPMTGMVMVAPDGLASDAELGEWVGQALAFASSLPPK
jgi:TfoX/Sxy family transcriptional regulator of competence genes